MSAQYPAGGTRQQRAAAALTGEWQSSRVIEGQAGLAPSDGSAVLWMEEAQGRAEVRDTGLHLEWRRGPLWAETVEAP